MGENVAGWLGINKDEIAYWPGGTAGSLYRLNEQSPEILQQFDRAKIILFASHCGVHSYYEPDMVKFWQEKGYHVIAHPECRKVVVDLADSHGSTAFIWNTVTKDAAGTKKYAIATEDHLVQNLRFHCQLLGIDVVNVGQAPIEGQLGMGCGCATMSRNDPPHLVALLDLLHKGKAPDINRVIAGDVVNEFTGERKRLDAAGQAWLIENAKRAMDNMILLSEA
jgi:quinolinate synthase